MRWVYQDFVVRTAEEADSSVLVRWWNDGRVMAHAGYPNGTGETLDDVLSLIKQQNDQTHRSLMIEKAGVLIGEMFYGVRENGVEIV